MWVSPPRGKNRWAGTNTLQSGCFVEKKIHSATGRRRLFDNFLFRGDSYCSVILIRRRRYPDIVYIAIILTEKYI